jgi:hypothetical protein
MKVMRQTLLAARNANILMSGPKVQCGRKVTFTGAVISQFGASPDPRKAAAIDEMEPPENIANLRQFIGLCNQYFSNGYLIEVTPHKT